MIRTLFAFFLLAHSGNGFAVIPVTQGHVTGKMFTTYATTPEKEWVEEGNNVQSSSSVNRKAFLNNILQGTVATVVVVSISNSVFVEPAVASGGATAGGAYLLSAKQRYNNRVKSGVMGFLSLGPLLEQGDINGLRNFFASEDVGSWKDFSSAGYLLANAFRTNSSASPDSLPSVKAWKAYAGQVEKMTAALKKKDTDSALGAYKNALTALDEYLGKVELPAAKEITP